MGVARQMEARQSLEEFVCQWGSRCLLDFLNKEATEEQPFGNHT